MIFNTHPHPWVAKLKQKAILSGISLAPAALRLFEKLAAILARTVSPGNRYCRLPDDFCFSPARFSIMGRDFSIDISLDHILPGGQAVQASFLVEKNGGGWVFMIHDPLFGVVRQEWRETSDVAARSPDAMRRRLQGFFIHLQSNHP
jgi:hypothetical protein